MTPFDLNPRQGRLAVLAIWLLSAIITIATHLPQIRTLGFYDPDDALRFVEVRDWMAGQSWFDVTQYRIHPPEGVPMHWNRLVDVPIALAIRFFALFTTPDMAIRAALAVVPMLTLLALMAVLYALTTRVTGRRIMGVVATAMLVTTIGTMLQLQPMRIDHHGWQIVLGLLSVHLLLGVEGPDVRRGALAGLVSATAMTISLEGMPLCAAIGGILALRYLRDGREGATLTAWLGAVALGGATLVFATMGWPRAFVTWCDSYSPAYIVPLLAACLALFSAWMILPQRDLAARIATLAAGGAAAAVTYGVVAQQCVAGPFAQLDPIVYQFWYLKVPEGLPIWKQSLDMALMLPVPSLFGLVGALLAIRAAPLERRERWLTLFLLQAATFALSIMVLRSMGIAHALALPGVAWLFVTAFEATRRFSSPVLRVLAGSGCIILLPICAQLLISALIPMPNEKMANASAGRTKCTDAANLRGLAALPMGTIFAPLDISAHLIAFTPHSVVATGHHRNREGMRQVISAFIAPPDKARAIVAQTPARYLAICTDEYEVLRYAQIRGSLAGQLRRGRVPAWLQPLPMRPRERIHVYRILR